MQEGRREPPRNGMELALSLSGTAAVRHDRRASVGGDVDGGSSVCSVGSNTSLRIVEHRFRAYPLVKKNPMRHPRGKVHGAEAY